MAIEREIKLIADVDLVLPGPHRCRCPVSTVGPASTVQLGGDVLRHADVVDGPLGSHTACAYRRTRADLDSQAPGRRRWHGAVAT